MKAKLYADGGSRGNPGPAASGAVLYADDGTLLAEIGEYLGRTTNNVAEWNGLRAGLERARDLGVSEIVIRLDSELVVRQVTGIYRVKHAALIPLAARVKALLRGFAKVDIGHVPRKQNAAADAIVNRVLDAAAQTSVADAERRAGLSG
ncbi:MAG: ribonuclease HI family protein [Candidatus Eremiobacteraeota bacterium]|nr:ribonuclease HI family protein [Candidatus Eremiobacteraeota bacterium]